jgi:RNA polymerase sigma factor (sigma-70 family)
MAQTDSELWRSACADRVEAFGELFDRHSDAICGYCFRRTADRAAAEDLVSIVFLEAWRRRHEVRFHGESVRPWLFGVATNVVRNHQRSLRRYRAVLARLPRSKPEPDFADEVGERIDTEADVRAIADVVACLPRQEQEVFALCAWQGLSASEVATALRLPEATVRTRLFRARRRIRDRFAPFRVTATVVPKEARQR